MKDYKINHVLICGHEPLITYKYKKDNKNKYKDKSAYIQELIDIIFKEKTKYTIPFTYLCADYHVYQYSKISINDLVIDQIILGTGGGELDELVPISTTNFKIYNGYTLTIMPNIVNNITNNETYGISNYGYGELNYDITGLRHTFIPIPIKSNYYHYNNDWEKKYLKYKNKYLKLKEKL